MLVCHPFLEYSRPKRISGTKSPAAQGAKCRWFSILITFRFLWTNSHFLQPRLVLEVSRWWMIRDWKAIYIMKLGENLWPTFNKLFHLGRRGVLSSVTPRWVAWIDTQWQKKKTINISVDLSWDKYKNFANLFFTSSFAPAAMLMNESLALKEITEKG